MEQLYNNYKIGVYQYLQDEKSNILNALNKIGDVLDKSGAYDNFETHMEKIHDLIDSWMDIYQPIYYFDRLENPQNSKNEHLEVLFLARLVYVKYYNAAGNVAIVENGLKNLLASNINEIPEFDVAIESDLERLKRNEANGHKRIGSENNDTNVSGDEITYFNASVGANTNTVLKITNKEISWGNTTISTEDVVSLNWGQDVQKVFLFLKNKDSKIEIKTKKETIKFQPRNKYFSQIVDALWKSAGFRLCYEIFEAISNDKKISIIDMHENMASLYTADLQDRGVLASMMGLKKVGNELEFQVKPRIEFIPWSDIKVDAFNGRMYIMTKKGEPLASASFIEYDNAPILFAALRFYYDKRKSPNDKISDVFYREFN